MIDKDICHFLKIYKKLPQYLGTEIFKYLIDNLSYGFYFTELKIPHYVETNYSKKYEMAQFNNNERFFCINGYILSRIKKKNGKHRYYLSEETRTYTCNGCGYTNCRNNHCRGSFDLEIKYKSKYISKSLNDVILQLYCYEN